MDQPKQNTGPTDKKYQIVEKLGEGAFGAVYKAIKVSTNSICAMKKISLDQVDRGIPVDAIREISILKELNHENIVILQDVQHFDESLWLVLEYLDMDLKKYIETHPELSTNAPLIKDFLRQLLLGLSYCHSHRIVHRDLKPNNLLMDCQTNTLKLADFGLARAFHSLRRKYTNEESFILSLKSLVNKKLQESLPNPFLLSHFQKEQFVTTRVVTLWYRAPEILLGSQHYSASVDIWSVGCIFAEMLTGRVLFEGFSELQQLGEIFGLMGTPTYEAWPGMRDLPRYEPVPYQSNPQDLQVVFPGLDPVGVDLLSRMLRMNPAERITAKDALAHPFFNNAGVAEAPSQGPPP